MTTKQDAKGVAVIAAFVETLPATPGVYRMLAANGDALYVGKAKNLKKRVVNYTRPEKQSFRIQRMIAETASMEFTTTHTEAEALLLEANIIKQLKPRYNILLRDDKSFPYILLTGDHDFPQVAKHRGAKDRAGEYFGPFASVHAVNETIATLQKAFLLRNCSDHVFANRTRPCLQYQIKRCTAPCVGKVTHQAYQRQTDMARQFLNGKSRAIQDTFSREMQKASDAEDFETAAAYRDRIRALTQIQSHQNIHLDGMADADIHALYQEQGQTCVQVFFFRAGQNFGNRAYFPRHDKDDTTEQILAAFVAQFYTNKPVPRHIVTSHPVAARGLMESALSEKSGGRVTIVSPQRGAKKDIMKMAVQNARDALRRRMAESASQTALFERLAVVFDLNAPPERIEVYDNSHISGSHALGAMIVATPAGFQKHSYRKFNMREQKIAGDDYGMMREMIARRFKSLLKAETNGESPQRPDLILIDGGQGQLNAVLPVMEELGITDVAVAAIAKGPDRNAGREKFFMKNRDVFTLEQNDPVLYFLQRVRDEAHRLAITSHRAKRRKTLTQNPLDDIAGIGAKRKKALLLHFGSAKAVAEAGVGDLQKVTGISKAVAEKIYNFFHDQP